eukprot:g19412.t1
MGNSCSCRRVFQSEEYYRELFAEEQKKREAEVAAKAAALEEEKAKQQQEQSRIDTEDAKSRKEKAEFFLAILRENKSIFRDETIKLIHDVMQGPELAKKIKTVVESAVGQLSARLDSWKEKYEDDICSQLKWLVEGQKNTELVVRELANFKTQFGDNINDLQNEHSGLSRELQLTKLEITEDFRKINESLAELRVELEVVGSANNDDEGEVKLVVGSLEKSLRDVMNQIEMFAGRLDVLGDEIATLMEFKSAYDEKMEDPVCVDCDDDDAPKPKGTKKTNIVDSDSDSEGECEHEIPRTIGKPGVNAVDVIDWDRLTDIQKKPRSSMTKFDDVVLRTLNDPPSRSELSWRRWKETAFLWAKALRRVRCNFNIMGNALLNKSLHNHEGEYNMAISVSKDRNLVAMMKHLDVKFSIPIRTIMEKCEELAPNVKRLDGQAPLMFLQLLQLVFLREVEIGGQRSEHNKVTRALAGLRLNQASSQLLRSRLPAAVHDLDFHSLETLVDQLNITDTMRFDAEGKEHEPNKKGEKDVIMELMVSMGERLQADGGLHHTNMNNFFRAGANGGKGGSLFYTPGEPGSGTPESGGYTLNRDGLNFATTGAGSSSGGGGRQPGHQKSKEEKTKEDDIYFKKLADLTPAQRDERLKGRMTQLLKINPDENHWRRFGDWCESIPKSGKCKGKHSGPEFGRLIRKFERDYPEQYAKWHKESEEYKKKQQEKAKAEKAGKNGNK